VSDARTRLFSEAVGPLGNPASALEALRSGRVDMIALDSYWLDLVRHHDPARLGGVITVGHTAWAPIPLLVSAPGVDPKVTGRLREVLLGLHERPEYGAALTEVVLERFEAPDVTAYSSLENLAADAERTGYATIA
jgi:ABC-type phosphate/phosphonate transport system substrate-binding protein